MWAQRQRAGLSASQGVRLAVGLLRAAPPTWLTCTPACPTGSGVVTWSVAANNGCTSRSGTLAIGGQPFSVNRTCGSGSFSILPSAPVTGAGGNGSGKVTATSGCCYWIASSPVSWITTSASGNGNGTASYSVAANSSSSSHFGTLTIAGQRFTAPCSYSLSPRSVAVPAIGELLNATAPRKIPHGGRLGTPFCWKKCLLVAKNFPPWKKVFEVF